MRCVPPSLVPRYELAGAFRPRHRACLGGRADAGRRSLDATRLRGADRACASADGVRAHANVRGAHARLAPPRAPVPPVGEGFATPLSEAPLGVPGALGGGAEDLRSAVETRWGFRRSSPATLGCLRRAWAEFPGQTSQPHP